MAFVIVGGVVLAGAVAWRALRRRQSRRANMWLTRRAVGHKRPDLR